MKNLIKNIGILLLTMMSIVATAQQVERSYFPPRTSGWWTLGINGGWAYQQSDVPATLEGYGFGMTLAKNLYYRPGGAVSFDARGRWLYSQTIGLDTKRSTGFEFNSALNGSRAAGEGLDYTLPGYVFQNHKTHQFELGLEGMLTANRLRERTGIIASIYGGINLDWYNPLLDQSNSNGEYDYSGISVDDSKSSVKSILRNNILDGVYETNAHGFEDGTGAIKFMPSLGIELGYQVTPRFSMHVGHKATFAQTDDLDGELWDNTNNVTAENDVHHYTNLSLQWILNPKENRMDPPVIEVTRPRTSPFISNTRNGQVDAKIKNVKSQADITCLVNGRNTSFSFNKGKFRTNFPLDYGNNEIIITASNQVGTDEETVIIYYGEPDTPPVVGNSGNNNSPKVNITSPRNSSHTTENEDITIQATIQYIDRKDDIEFLVNGRRVTNFNYDNGRNQFSGDVRLQEGRNEIEIIARNETGSDRDNVVVIYEKKTTQPQVRITAPSRNPYETTQSNITVRADIDNVTRKDDVRYYVNGRERSLFDFDTRSGAFRADVNLVNGRNEIRVKGYNESGEDQDEITIIYSTSTTTTPPPPAGERPVVTITSVSGSSASNCKTTIKATILNIRRQSDITFKLNGRTHTNFSYNSKTRVFSSTVNLVDGNNTISILARNDVGSDEDRDNKRCESYTPPPPPTNKPQVTINTPENNSTATSGTTKLNARIKYVNRKQDVQVKLNGNTINDFSFSQISGVVTANLNLQNGNNTISVWGRNNDGTDEESVNVRYNAPSNPPTVDITQPSSNATTDTKTAVVKAKILNVNGKQDIRFTFNGINFTNFSYSTSSKILTANVSLKEGSNTITIKATTNDGSDSETVRVNYNTPKILPTVKISRPSNNSTTESQNVSITAKVRNVSSKSNVTFTLNGSKLNSFSLSGTKFQGTVKLKEGRNTIIVKGTNNDGTAQDEVSVTYTPKVTVAKPVVKFTNPRRRGTSVTKKDYTFQATVQNVQRQNQISVKLNGRSTNFNFDASRKTITVPSSLKTGTNSIVITATNEGGSTSAETSLIFNSGTTTAVQKPKVTITSVSTPTTNPFNPGVSGSNITGKVENVTSKSQITITHNGNKITDFTYSTSTKQFQVAIQLEANATNKVVITAKTRSGSDQKEHTY